MSPVQSLQRTAQQLPPASMQITIKKCGSDLFAAIATAETVDGRTGLAAHWHAWVREMNSICIRLGALWKWQAFNTELKARGKKAGVALTCIDYKT